MPTAQRQRGKRPQRHVTKARARARKNESSKEKGGRKAPLRRRFSGAARRYVPAGFGQLQRRARTFSCTDPDSGFARTRQG